MATIGGCLNGGCRLCIDMFFPGLSLFPLRCSHTGTPFAFAFANLAWAVSELRVLAESERPQRPLVLAVSYQLCWKECQECTPKFHNWLSKANGQNRSESYNLSFTSGFSFICIFEESYLYTSNQLLSSQWVHIISPNVSIHRLPFHDQVCVEFTTLNVSFARKNCSNSVVQVQ